VVIVFAATDLAKIVVALHGVNEAGKVTRVEPAVARAKHGGTVGVAAAVHDRDEGMQRCAPLGAQLRDARPPKFDTSRTVFGR
jgi:hypothetical protein